MSMLLKSLLCFLMVLALFFGFCDAHFPLEKYSYERLHIFLFNLCAGGTILLYYTQGSKKMTGVTRFFLAGALIYALTAFWEFYPATLAVTPLLVAAVEKVRIQKFGFWPGMFFQSGAPVAEKFHLSALLCLSIALILAAVAIINTEYAHWVDLDKFTLNTFFLGFSFPLSLVSLHLVFGMLSHKPIHLAKFITEACFWSITLGVIIFFLFILMEQLLWQLVISALLFVAVFTVFWLYARHADPLQQKLFLSSGIGFLIFTAVTGIGYIFLEMSPGYDPAQNKWLLHLHVFASLYGWNLSGLAVACRFPDFPITMHSPGIIGVHWVTVAFLAPLGLYYPIFAILTLGVYIFITLTLFFSRNKKKR